MAFKCSICENDYSSAPILRRHINEKHENIRFKCDCGMDFSRKLTLNKHLENCNGESNSLNIDNNIISDGIQSLDSKFNSDKAEDVNMGSNNLSKSSESNDDYITDDYSVPEILANNSRKSKMSSNLGDEYGILKPSRKRVSVINNFKYCSKDSRKSKMPSDSGDEDEILKPLRNRVDVFNTFKHSGKGESEKSDVSDDEPGNESEENSEDNLESQSDIVSESDSSHSDSESETITKKEKLCRCNDCQYQLKRKNLKVKTKYSRDGGENLALSPYQQYYLNQLNGVPNMANFYAQNAQAKYEVFNRVATPLYY